ncbi:MAG: Uncharacterized protein XD88_1912 [Methanocalculus sp. 52_23]|nr:MAG: Uncharacterized protein XD88_1912 [Methanocalculus sp. 52_23]
MMLPMIFIGFLLANALIKSRYIKYTNIPMALLTKKAYLPVTCSSALTFYFFNSWTGVGVLSTLFRDKIINERHVIVTVLIAMLPKGLHSVLFFQIPVAIAVLGYSIGLLLLAIELLVFSLIAFLGIIIGRRLFQQEPCVCKMEGEAGEGSEELEEAEKPEETKKQNKYKKWISHIGAVFAKTLYDFAKVAVVLIPTTILFLAIFNYGLIGYFEGLFRPLMSAINLPDVAIIVFTASFLSQVAVLSVAGTVIALEEITVLQTLLMLFIARILHLGLGYVKTSFPTNIALFGKSLGTRVTCIEFITVESGLFSVIIILLLIQSFL